MNSSVSVKRSWILMVPKILISLLLMIALLDPCWRVIRPTEDAQKIAILTDVSTSMGVKDGKLGSRGERAGRISKKFKKYEIYIEGKNTSTRMK